MNNATINKDLQDALAWSLRLESEGRVEHAQLVRSIASKIADTRINILRMQDNIDAGDSEHHDYVAIPTREENTKESRIL